MPDIDTLCHHLTSAPAVAIMNSCETACRLRHEDYRGPVGSPGMRERMFLAMKRKMTFALVLMALMCLCACGSDPEVTPTDTVNQFLQAIQKDDISLTEDLYEDGTFDLSAAAWPLQDDDEDLSSDAFVEMMQDDFYPKLINFDYEVTDEKISGSTATVTLDVTTYALGDAMYQGYQDYFADAPKEDGETVFDEEALTKDIGANFQKATKKTEKATIEITMSIDDDKWVIDTLSDDATDALTGGMVTCQSKVEKYLDEIYS